jgi:hypothetical protein
MRLVSVENVAKKKCLADVISKNTSNKSSVKLPILNLLPKARKLRVQNGGLPVQIWAAQEKWRGVEQEKCTLQMILEPLKGGTKRRGGVLSLEEDPR